MFYAADKLRFLRNFTVCRTTSLSQITSLARKGKLSFYSAVFIEFL